MQGSGGSSSYFHGLAFEFQLGMISELVETFHETLVCRSFHDNQLSNQSYGYQAESIPSIRCLLIGDYHKKITVCHNG
jgi:hypothetical protein